MDRHSRAVRRVHVLPELQREAADRMDQALGYTDTDGEDQDPPETDLGIDGA